MGEFVCDLGRWAAACLPMAEADGVALLEQVYALGVRHFDTAEVYRSGNAFEPPARVRANRCNLAAGKGS